MYGFELNNDAVFTLISVIKENYSCDFSEYSITSFKHRLSEVIRNHSLQTIDELIYRVSGDTSFFDFFLKEISVSETEAFRDTVIWRIIRFDIIKNLYEKIKTKIRIWLPGCTTGEELFSLVIILKENYFLDKVEIMASSISSKCIEQIKAGVFSIKKGEINLANYLRYKGKSDFKTYYSVTANKATWDTGLIENVEFLKPMSLFNDPPENIHLILFRNSMIYYNYNLQNKVLRILHKSLTSDGYLILGAKETLGNFDIKDKFSVVNEKESIYKKN
ncbi:MAG: protein-glutamate O-methyltransferase CheR [Bacteroidia bacterium]|nr:protein-glutamate O-methyltransferase CheR [Bacteroidia bacterium]